MNKPIPPKRATLPPLPVLRTLACWLAAMGLATACDTAYTPLPQPAEPQTTATATKPANTTTSNQPEYVTVQRVVDGDTVWVYADNPHHTVKVRLIDIDAPERCQDWGKQSGQALRKKLQGHIVKLERHGTDKYQRVLAVLYMDGENINAWLVEQGHAWAARWHGSVQNYGSEEWSAQRHQRGLWSHPNQPIYPRDFRRSGVRCD